MAIDHISFAPDPAEPMGDVFAKMNQVIDAVNPTIWTNVTLINGWAVGNLAMPVQYRKVGDIVYLRGQLDPITGPASNAHAFTLPIGFWAARQSYVPVSEPDLSGGTCFSAEINTDGSFRILISVLINLDGINFSTSL